MINMVAAILLWSIAVGLWVLGKFLYACWVTYRWRVERYATPARITVRLEEIERMLGRPACTHWPRDPVTICTGEEVAYICRKCNVAVVNESWIATGANKPWEICDPRRVRRPSLDALRPGGSNNPWEY